MKFANATVTDALLLHDFVTGSCACFCFANDAEAYNSIAECLSFLRIMQFYHSLFVFVLE